MDVAIEQPLTVVFSEAMDIDHTFAAFDVGGGAVDLVWEDDRTVTSNFAEWPAASTATVTIGTGQTDTAGNGLAVPFVLTFTTVSATPELLDHAPADGAVDVVRNASIRLRFSRPMDDTSLESDIVVSDPSKTDLGFDVTDGDDGWYTLSLWNDMTATTEITAEIGTGVASHDGYTMDQAVTFSFTTGTTLDETPPTLLSIEPADGTVIPASTSELVFTFDEAVDPESFSPAMLSGQFLALFESSGADPVWSGDGTVVTVPLPTPLPAGLPIVARFDGYSDVNGNHSAEIVHYRVDVAGDGEAWPFVDGSRFVYDVDETVTPAGGSPVPNEFSNHYQVEEQADGRIFWSEYPTQDFVSRDGYDIFRPTSTAVEFVGFDYTETEPDDTGTFTPSVEWAKLPFAVQTWSSTSTMTTPEGAMTLAYGGEVTGREDVTALIGDEATEVVWVDCWRLERTYTLSAGPDVLVGGTATTWYAPTIGVVRNRTLETDEDGTVEMNDEHLTSVWF